MGSGPVSATGDLVPAAHCLVLLGPPGDWLLPAALPRASGESPTGPTSVMCLRRGESPGKGQEGREWVQVASVCRFNYQASWMCEQPPANPLSPEKPLTCPSEAGSGEGLKLTEEVSPSPSVTYVGSWHLTWRRCFFDFEASAETSMSQGKTPC